MEEKTTPARMPSTEDLAHLGRGVLMGAADIVPGVSGGTVALIVGIYARLVTAISHCDRALLSHLAGRQWSAAAKHIDLRFLVFLGLGIGCGAVALGAVMHTLLEDYRQYTLAAFFGLIGASCWLVARLVGRWAGAEAIAAIAGAAFAIWLVQQEALNHPPDALWYVFLCGVVAICAMILPGISGSFILVILGKYHDITGIIKNAVHLQVTGRDIATVILFGMGCAVGLVGFSKFLRWLLLRHQNVTMATLCGFMAGSLLKIWPFQRDLTPEIEELKYKRFALLGPEELTLDRAFWLTLLVGLIAGAFVLGLDRVAGTRGPVSPDHQGD